MSVAVLFLCFVGSVRKVLPRALKPFANFGGINTVDGTPTSHQYGNHRADNDKIASILRAYPNILSKKICLCKQCFGKYK
ncbi:MAG: hypothetical protein PHU14_08230 [Methylovulum sp.]|nr:hypothetical protein [Methylovulum sp.]